MKKNDVLVCVDVVSYGNSVLNTEALNLVLNSSVITEEEKNYFINMFCRLYHLECVEKSFNQEIETGEITELYINMDKLISRAKLEYNYIYDKYIIYNSNTNEYLSCSNELEDEFEDSLSNTILDIKTYSTKEKALEDIKKLNLNDSFEVIKINKLTEIDGSNLYNHFETFNYLDLIDNSEYRKLKGSCNFTQSIDENKKAVNL